MHRLLRVALGGLVALVFVSRVVTGEEVRVGNREELVAAFANAKPGTTILVAAGNYRGGISAAKLSGSKERPIVVAAADAANPPLIDGGRSGLHLSSPQYLELRDLVFDGASGNGLNVDDSGSVDTPARGLTLRNVVVRNIGPRGNTDGIKLSGVREFRIEGCRVERWGSGGSAIDMVGCTKGVVTGCKFAEARGDQANGVQTKGGSSDIAIQRCRFENAGGRAVNVGGSTGLGYFRPRDATFEAKDITVEDCEFIGSLSAVAFVGVDGAVVRHNTIYRPRRWAFRILQENTDSRFVACRNGKVTNNVIAFRSDEVRQIVNIGGNTVPDSFAFSGNAWSCLDRPQDTERLVRLPTAETNGTYGEAPRFADPEQGDVRIQDRKPEDAGVRPADDGSELNRRRSRRERTPDAEKVHDPSTILVTDGIYRFFCTGRGVTLMREDDAGRWLPEGRLFADGEFPPWHEKTVPGNRGHLWAPDVIKLSDKYFVYYSVSTFGKNTSAIGLAVGESVDPKSQKWNWHDRGPVVTSQAGDRFNAIDPAIFRDATDGALWMTFGSFWDGIHVVELDPASGLRRDPKSVPIRLASAAEIEAPFLHRRDAYYYLFVNWGKCCRGVNSTYEIRVGRSRKVTGPFLDSDNVDLCDRGGTLVLASADRWIGPGHASLVDRNGRQWLVHHYYDRELGGRSRLRMVPLDWDDEGWPVVAKAADSAEAAGAAEPGARAK